jgi:hypothetical protein
MDVLEKMEGLGWQAMPVTCLAQQRVKIANRANIGGELYRQALLLGFANCPAHRTVELRKQHRGTGS